MPKGLKGEKRPCIGLRDQKNRAVHCRSVTISAQVSWLVKRPHMMTPFAAAAPASLTRSCCRICDSAAV
jgi:hypothetical protein